MPKPWGFFKYTIPARFHSPLFFSRIVLHITLAYTPTRFQFISNPHSPVSIYFRVPAPPLTSPSPNPCQPFPIPVVSSPYRTVRYTIECFDGKIAAIGSKEPVRQSIAYYFAIYRLFNCCTGGVMRSSIVYTHTRAKHRCNTHCPGTNEQITRVSQVCDHI